MKEMRSLTFPNGETYEIVDEKARNDINELDNRVIELEKKYVVDSGSNANGHYRKWSDGTLEMWGTINIANIVISKSVGLIFYSDPVNITFPITSLTTIDVTGLTPSTNGAIWCSSATGGDKKATTTLLLFSAVVTTVTSSGRLTYEVKGTWK